MIELTSIVLFQKSKPILKKFNLGRTIAASPRLGCGEVARETTKLEEKIIIAH